MIVSLACDDDLHVPGARRAPIASTSSSVRPGAWWKRTSVRAPRRSASLERVVDRCVAVVVGDGPFVREELRVVNEQVDPRDQPASSALGSGSGR